MTAAPMYSNGWHSPGRSSAPTLRIHASAVKLGEWRAALDAADEPPPSPVERPEGAVERVELVPYGATELRMGALPWAKQAAR